MKFLGILSIILIGMDVFEPGAGQCEISCRIVRFGYGDQSGFHRAVYDKAVMKQLEI